MNGFVAATHGGFAFITGEDHQTYFAYVDEFPTDEIGRRYLLAGENVSFHPGLNKKGRTAINLKLLDNSRKRVSPNYRELCTVEQISAHGDYAFLKRPYGETCLFLHIKEFGPEGTVFFIGQEISVAISPAPPKVRSGRWTATQPIDVSKQKKVNAA